MPSLRIRAALAATAAGIPVLFAGLAMQSAAAAQPTPPPVTDFATYPQPELIPVTCPGEGNEGTNLADIVVGPSYVVTGGAAAGTYNSLRAIAAPLEPGDVISMTWRAFLPGCEDATIALSIKESDEAVFDPTDNQMLINTPSTYDACGPAGVPCVAGGGGRFGPLTVTIPSRTTTCHYQVDSTVGPPLTIVGPSGSFYSSAQRGDDGPTMLVSAFNGGFPCEGTLVVDKDWVLDGVLGDTPPANLPPGFTITVISLGNLGAELGRAVSTDGGVTFAYTNTSGNTASLDIRGDGSIQVVEEPPLPGGTSTHTTTCTSTATLDCTADLVNTWSTSTTSTTSTSTTSTTTSTTTPTTLPTTAPTVLPTTIVNTTAPVQPSTVAPSTTVQGTLPRTGTTSEVLAGTGGAMIVLGLAALLWARPPGAARRSR